MNHTIALDDLRLAQRAKAEPASAMQVLDRLCPRVYQVVHMMVGGSGEADEFVQMCLVEILEHLHQFRGDGSLESWAGQVAYRVMIRALKKKRQSREDHTTLFSDQLPTRETPERALQRQELWEQLTEKLDSIPLKRRTALLLHVIDGYTVPEVAELTEVSVNTVKDHLKLAYRELRTIFAQNSSLKDAMLEEIHE